ncbi:MAG: Dihydroorotase [Alphaproteobacteria bacterium MarineAlpha5_Bin9]|nr:MAG: Dihydroorotase [Alphaproteobacteria bacterium MarineAlpha5_Bin9]
MKNINLTIYRPDDWHVHLREGELLNAVINSTARFNGRCIAMPNLENPITTTKNCLDYKNNILKKVKVSYFEPLIPCYLTDNIDINDFKNGIKNNIFFGAKLYPVNATTNSKKGVTAIDKIFPSLEVLSTYNKPLLIHGEKIGKNINIFDREKYFIDDELKKIISFFPNLKIVLEHVSTKYGADFVNQTKNLAATITPHHMILTKKDVFNDEINCHNYCMPVVKEQKDLRSLREYACSGNESFFIGTDSAPHQIIYKQNDGNLKPGIFSAPCSLELYAQIFDEENSLQNLERFSSLNGPKFYGMTHNKDKITLIKKEWKLEEFTTYKDIKIKNFYSDKYLKWQILN